MSFSPSEEARLRALLSTPRSTGHGPRSFLDEPDETPWESGVGVRELPRSKQQQIADGVVTLELKLEALFSLLVDAGVVPPDALQNKLEELRREAQETIAAQQEAERAAEKAAREKKVSCARCNAEVLERDTFLSGHGTLCPQCYHALEG